MPAGGCAAGTWRTKRQANRVHVTVEHFEPLGAQISEALEGITAAVGQTSGAASEIKLMTQQQTTASEQMADTIAEVRDVANQVAASSQETTQSIAELTSLVESLRRVPVGA